MGQERYIQHADSKQHSVPAITVDMDDADHDHQGCWDIFTAYTSKPLTRKARALGVKTIGRANAGIWGRRSRIIRAIANVIVVVGFALGIALFGTSIFFSGGIALFVWPLIIAYIGVALNLVGVGIGWIVNTLKIEQYYDYQLELLAETNQLRKNLQDKPDESQKKYIKQALPHGLMAHKKPNPRLFLTLLIRYLHDANGFTGTLMSGIVTMIALTSEIVTGPVATMALFIISRVSALLSASVAWYTNHDRLEQNKKVITHLQDKHLDLQAEQLDENFKIKIEVIVGKFAIDPDKKYGNWVLFTLKKVLFANKGLIDKLDNNETVNNCLENILFADAPTEHNTDNRNRYFNRRQLSQAPADADCCPVIHKHKLSFAVLDFLPVLEAKIYMALAKNALGNKFDEIKDFAEAVVRDTEAYKGKYRSQWGQSLVFYLLKAIADKVISDKNFKFDSFKENKQALKDHINKHLTSDGQPNREKLQDFKVAGNPHDDTPFLPHFHASAVVGHCPGLVVACR